MLASLLFPYDDDAPNGIEGWLNELESQKCVVRYTVDGKHYLQIENWTDHQRIDRPSPSRYPSYDDSSNPRECSAKAREPSTLDQGSRKGPRKGPRSNTSSGDDGREFEEFWKVVKRKTHRADAQKAFKRARKSHSLEHILSMTQRYYGLFSSRQDLTYAAYPATFLNKCLSDDPDEWIQRTQAGNGSGLEDWLAELGE